MFTKEEIEQNNVNIFEHVEHPQNISEMKAIFRMLDIVPIMEMALIDRVASLTKEKGIWKQLIKQKTTQASKIMENVCRQVYKNIDHSGENTEESYNGFVWFGTDMIEKFTAACVSYLTDMEKLTNASGDLTPEQQSAFFLEKIQFQCQLEVGDIFIFVDSTNYCEYTVLDIIDNNEKWEILYGKTTDPVKARFVSNNMFRPIIKRNIMGNDLKPYYQEIKEKYGRKLIAD